jgi:hypothetical protein
MSDTYARNMPKRSLCAAQCEIVTDSFCTGVHQRTEHLMVNLTTNSAVQTSSYFSYTIGRHGELLASLRASPFRIEGARHFTITITITRDFLHTCDRNGQSNGDEKYHVHRVAAGVMHIKDIENAILIFPKRMSAMAGLRGLLIGIFTRHAICWTRLFSKSPTSYIRLWLRIGFNRLESKPRRWLQLSQQRVLKFVGGLLSKVKVVFSLREKD